MQVKKLVTNGEGEFDEEEVLQTWPKALGLQERAVKRTLTDLAGKRKNDMLVQAVAALRTRQFEDVVGALNNVIACSKVKALCKWTLSLCTLTRSWQLRACPCCRGCRSLLL